MNPRKCMTCGVWEGEICGAPTDSGTCPNGKGWDNDVDPATTCAPDLVNKPAHYAKWKIEPITFIMKNDLPFHVGNIIKYAIRAGSKIYEGMDAVESEITDLEKVRRYAEMRINQLKNKETL